LYPCFVQLT